eukprot:TRINITY_DN5017_c0_g1_i9.p1 TRINITY_DN5017_c0_g1~~TRINITY_DN5017_c0_g1_i9.p1  ORF type:complete len:142 (-),score=10.18 TRINITY_DN5017_c0_g1_i9:214-639(-)
MMLQAPITHDEVKSAILQMKPSSAPRPDTLTAAIYQVDPDSVASLLILSYHQIQFSSSDMSTFTESITTLIPKKVTRITCFDHIRPISLYNFDYKIFSAVQSNTFMWIDFSKAFDSISHGFPSEEDPGREIPYQGTFTDVL